MKNKGADQTNMIGWLICIFAGLGINKFSGDMAHAYKINKWGYRTIFMLYSTEHEISHS